MLRMNKQELYDLIDKVADCMMHLDAGDFKEVCPVSNIDIDKWEWPQGLGMYALYRYYKISGRDEILQWLLAWYDRHLEKGLPAKNINTTVPLLALSYLYEHKPNPKYLEVIGEWAEAIMHEFPRTEEGGFQHSGSGIDYLYGQLWDDTLVMTGLFLGRAGMLLNKKEYIVECERQFLVHAKYLCNVKNGLWYHGWTFGGRHNFSEAFWGRGNCWISFAIADLLDFEGISESVRLYLQGVLYAQVKTLKEYQAENGMWHTLLDDPDTYVESSATAGIGYGILKGVRMGYLPEEYREVGKKAVQGICERITEKGAVLDVSYGTNVGESLEDYKEIPLCVMPYGQALTILLLTEAEFVL